MPRHKETREIHSGNSIIAQSGAEIFTKTKKEEVWDINKVEAVTAQARARCTRRCARNVRRNAKFLLSPRMSVRYTARIAFQSARARVVKRKDFVSLFFLAYCQKRHFKLFAGRYI
ncbi:MAG: hypothetical protein A2216_04055 [Omnitrophica WOR_2 bacterium RIFOXYA2_FULL_45_12]|nr:MAG: hypothetical protein A2216_04055 [Omnitrophica WOR_2 bacterium RIFOXYA2_FULL_45_12]